MPKDTKNQKKDKNEPKDQSKTKQAKQKTVSKDLNKSAEEKVPAKSQIKDPPPEVSKSLKKENDENLNETEDQNAKYKRKDIQSNWSKYEMPIETYDEIEHQEHLGADYEKLIQAPLSVGGHFQFKHEKTWDVNTGPSLYDKYFDINMEVLYNAISAIPLYSRNEIDRTRFNRTTIDSIYGRANKFKLKYYGVTLNTPEEEAAIKITNTIKEVIEGDEKKNPSENSVNKDINTLEEAAIKITNTTKEIIVGDENKNSSENSLNKDDNKDQFETSIPQKVDNLDKETDRNKLSENENESSNIQHFDLVDNSNNTVKATENVKDICNVNIGKAEIETEKDNSTTAEPSKNQVLESPKELEKWLDDFLDS